ncbi:hypothetical protein [Hyphococcus sp.]|uniref:hypothetical protein n=1 Tax=Hyphococcus sp. TaxID=2038636 RepID=UPI00207FFCEC|nr:MAG: hypothetical protein DHS20C04_04910 [Marinicaulis sp.]
MSFRELSSWIVLVAMLWVFGSYAFELREAESFGAGTTAAMFGTIIGFVVIVVIAHILVAIFAARSGDEAADERDRRITLRAEEVAGFVLGAWALGALAVALTQGYYLVANILFLGLAASEIAKNAFEVFLYRRGS